MLVPWLKSQKSKLDAMFKLEKLKIAAFTDVGRTHPVQVNNVDLIFEAMFNPESISHSLAVQYANPVGMGSSSKSLTYSYRPSTTLTMKLILDDRYYNSLLENKFSWKHKSVKARVQAFLEAAYDIDSSIHQPRWLRLEWGTKYAVVVQGVQPVVNPQTRHPSFDCRLSSVDIKYTSFDREGNPTGAELDIVLIEDIADALRVREDNFQSPDVTHFRIVKAGDTLPLLSNAVYGDPSYYLTVAQFNGLDDFRNLQAGQKLYFPPLT